MKKEIGKKISKIKYGINKTKYYSVDRVLIVYLGYM